MSGMSNDGDMTAVSFGFREYRREKWAVRVPMDHRGRRERWARLMKEPDGRVHLERTLARYLHGQLGRVLPLAVMGERVTLVEDYSDASRGEPRISAWVPAVREVAPEHGDLVVRWLAGEFGNAPVLQVPVPQP